MISRACNAGPGGAPPATLVELFTAMHDLGKPIIAMVNGHALAGGLGLMVACDLVIASDAAQFGTTEIAVGLWPMMITAELTRSVGRKQVLEMMLTGKKLTAAEAVACGLRQSRRAGGRARGRDDASSRTRSRQRSPAAIRLGLQAFYRSQDMEHEPQLRYLQGELGRVLALDDAKEGITAFLQKRASSLEGPLAHRSVMTVLRIDHVQLSIPPGGEAEARQVLRRRARISRGAQARGDARARRDVVRRRASTSASSPT